MSQSEHQELFDQLMSRGKDSPFARFALTDEQGNDELDYVVFIVDLIGSEIEAHRERLRGGDDELPLVPLKKKYASLLSTCSTSHARQDLLFYLQRLEDRPGRGRPTKSSGRWPLIHQIYMVYPKGAARLTQGSRRDRGRARDTASHFEATVKLALDISGDRIEDVHAECLAAVRALRKERINRLRVNLPG